MSYHWALKKNIAFVLCLIWLAACGTDDGYSNRADVKRYGLMGLDSPGSSFNLHLDVFDYENASDTPIWDTEEWTGGTWHRIELKGTSTTEGKAWIDATCGKQISWELMDNDTHALIRSFYQELPLRTSDDVDAVFEHALPSADASAAPAEKWQLELHAPDHYLRTLLSNTDDTAQIISVIEDFDQRLEAAKTDASPYVFFSLNLPEEATTAKALVAYLEDFSDAALRTYLEKNKPECLVK